MPNFSGTYTHSVTTGNCLIIEIATKTGEMESVLDATSGANLPGVFGSPQAVGSWYVDTYYEKVSSTEGGQKPTIEIGNIPGWGDAVMFLNEYSGLPNCSPTNKTFRGSSITNGQFASNALTTSSGSLGVGFIAFNSGTITKWSSTAPLTYLRAQIEPSWGSAGYGDAITPSGSFSFSGTLSSQSNLYGFALAVFH
ncbi:MAG TPA: hypothetical protein VMU07_03255 [Candidatus Paceibacterota bacterium]|nr:hypothetical protein [Candidatus Paceibacterota bacterium]